jgi:hypothetical protein
VGVGSLYSKLHRSQSGLGEPSPLWRAEPKVHRKWREWSRYLDGQGNQIEQQTADSFPSPVQRTLTAHLPLAVRDSAEGTLCPPVGLAGRLVVGAVGARGVVVPLGPLQLRSSGLQQPGKPSTSDDIYVADYLVERKGETVDADEEPSPILRQGTTKETEVSILHPLSQGPIYLCVSVYCGEKSTWKLNLRYSHLYPENGETTSFNASVAAKILRVISTMTSLFSV